MAGAADAAGIPYALSSLGTTSIEDLADAAPGPNRWFQLYVWRDRAFSQDLIDRARAAGYSALVLTVDVPVAGMRLRDIYNGLTIPPNLTVRTLVDGALHPAWRWDLLTTGHGRPSSGGNRGARHRCPERARERRFWGALVPTTFPL